MESLKPASRLVALPFLILVWVYQKTVSPDHGVLRIFYPYGFCKFHPTCSEYARQILRRDGIIGLPKIFKRVLACNPASLGGVDLP